MQFKKVKYLGPTGVNPDLGYVVNGSEINIPERFYDKYKNVGYIEDLESPKSIRKQKKSED